MDNLSLSEVHGTVRTEKRGFRKVLAFLGPAYLVSVGYMDPGNWATDIAGGSQFGYKLIWVLLMSNLMAILLQSLSSRLGIVAGLDLAQASRNAYPKWANLPLYILAEIAIAACDLAEIVGMAIGLNLIFGLPLVWGICITALDTILLLFLLHKGIRVMEAFIISLVAIIGVCFLIEMVIVSPVYSDVIKGFVPSKLNHDALYIAIGIIGATVMPHNLYLHSSLVQTRRIDPSPKGIRRAIKLNLLDTTIALNLAFFVNAAILILAAAAFFSRGFYGVAEIQDASVLLEELFGKAAPLFFGIALIAAGQSSTVTGTLAGQIVMEGHLHLRIQPWLRRLITRIVAIVPALFTIIYFGDEALGQLLVLSQVVLSLQLAFAVVPLIHFNSSKSLMGDFVIRPWVMALAWLCAAIIIYLNINLVIQEIQLWLVEFKEEDFLIYLLVIPLAIILLFLLGYVLLHPFFSKGSYMGKNLPAFDADKGLEIQSKNTGRESRKEYSIPHGVAESFTAAASRPYQKIGIAIDFTGKEQNVIQNAIKQGGRHAQYIFIHIVESAAATYLDKNAFDLETKMDIENLEKYVSVMKESGFNAEQKVGFGNPAKEISKIVKSEQVDLVVLGAHGHKGIKDLVFGTTVDKLRHRINVPVLIVK